MADINATTFSVADAVKRFAPGEQKLLQIAEVLSQDTSLFNDFNVKEGNSTDGHVIAARQEEPTPASRQINEGIDASKSIVINARETTSILETRVEIDEQLYNRAPDKQQFMANEGLAHISALRKAALYHMLYGTGQGQTLGFFSRMNTLANSQVVNGAGSSTGNTSMLIYSTNPMDAYTFFPLNGKAGLDFEDRGKERVTWANSKAGYAYVQKYGWVFGLAVENFRNFAAVRNIKVSSLTADASSGAKLFDLVCLAKSKVQDVDNLRLAVSPTVYAYMEMQAYSRATSYVTPGQWRDGTPMIRFAGLPVKRVEKISENETAIS